jgi:hypothetical protein
MYKNKLKEGPSKKYKEIQSTQFGTIIQGGLPSNR